MRYRVYLLATAFVKSSVEVEAPTKEDAKAKALENLGDVEWTYDGLNEFVAPTATGADPEVSPPLADGHARCNNCQVDTRLEDLHPIRRAYERLDQWGVSPVPAGECPACGALAYATR